jgi:nicotinamidase-related amidase
MSTGVIWPVIPSRMALMVIDMQKCFCSAGGAAEIPLAREIAPTIERLASTCRLWKIPVLWIRRIHARDRSDAGLYGCFGDGRCMDGSMGCIEGTAGVEFYEGVSPQPCDVLISKIRYSAFISGSSSAERILRTLGRDTVMVTGVATDWCCTATIMNGMELDFKMIGISDGMATFSKHKHEQALSLLGAGWAQISRAREMIMEISRAGLDEKQGHSIQRGPFG